jgi:platelet-activating factor acetylhydrolase IB subunit alpha
MDLENRNAALTEEISSAPRRGGASQADWVPRAPAAYTLTGHRAQVRNLVFWTSFILGLVLALG